MITSVPNCTYVPVYVTRPEDIYQTVTLTMKSHRKKSTTSHTRSLQVSSNKTRTLLVCVVHPGELAQTFCFALNGAWVQGVECVARTCSHDRIVCRISREGKEGGGVERNMGGGRDEDGPNDAERL